MRSQPRYQPGDRIGGRYQVHQALMGGMGEVYLCLDLETNLPFALKTFQQRYWTSLRLRAAFENEVATWVALEKHPNIVRCFLMDIVDNQPFMFLEWIAGDESRGTDLRSWLRHGPLGLQLALDFAIGICRGLMHAQEKQPGIVHRDLKPENILVTQSQLAKITDFGLATVLQRAGLDITHEAEGETNERQHLLSQKGLVGTPLYMAPEQWLGESIDVRTDIYAVGCMLYEMLTGYRPFQATTLDGLRHQHLEAAIPKLTDHQALPDVLDTLAARCMAKLSEKRFLTVSELMQQLTSLYELEFGELPRPIFEDDELSTEEYLNRGVTYHGLGRYEEALADHNRAIEFDPANAMAYNNRGLTLGKMQRWKEALADYSQAIKIDPTDAKTYSNRGIVYVRLQQHEKALADYDKAIELEPTNAKTYTNRGFVYYNMQQYERALTDHNKAIKLDPNLAEAYNNRGITLRALHREEALADYSRAIELDPADATAYYNRALAYVNQEQYEQALLDFNEVIKFDPTNANAYGNRGSTYARLRQ